MLRAEIAKLGISIALRRAVDRGPLCLSAARPRRHDAAD